MITIVRVDFKKCKFSSDFEEEEFELQEFLSFYIDGAQWSKHYKNGDWDGYKRFYDKQNKFDYGILDEVFFGLEQAGIKYKFIDKYKKENEDLFVKKYEINDILYYYQENAVKEFLKLNYGIIIVPTRGGKTFIASEIIRILRKKPNLIVLFIVDTTDLFKQSVEEISKYLNIKEKEIGKINDKGFNFNKVNIGMIQTIVSALYRKGGDRKRKRELEKFLLTVNFLAVDEIQEFSSKKRVNAIKKCKNINYCLGLSATPFKQLEENLIQNLTIKGIFGGVAYEIYDKELQDEGFLSLDKVLLINFNHKKKLGNFKTYHDFLKAYIIENRIRINKLCEIIKICKKIRFKTLVIFNSKQMGYIVSELLNINFISGDTKQKERDEAKNEFLKGRGKVLLVTNIWKKGITLPEAEILIIADGGLEGSNIIQKRGRVLGSVEGKNKALTIDIMDVGVKHFSEHSLNRLEVYSEKVGDDRMEVFMEDELDLMEESIKEWLND